MRLSVLSLSVCVCVIVCAISSACGGFSEAAGGPPASALQESIAHFLGLLQQLQVLLPVLFRQLQIRQLIFHQVDHVSIIISNTQHKPRGHLHTHQLTCHLKRETKQTELRE